MLDKLVELKTSNLFKNILVDKQYGSQILRWTEINLIIFYSYLIGFIKLGVHEDSIYMDLRKNFNSVDHSIFMIKLKNLSIM